VASDHAAVIGGLTKFVRITMQSLALGIGALLVLDNKLSPGGMIAASVLWLSHGRCLKALGVTTAQFYQEAAKQFSRFLLLLGGASHASFVHRHWARQHVD
jgi:ABC-type protease/lipase transport system fused ATPase/permease subunit